MTREHDYSDTIARIKAVIAENGGEVSRNYFHQLCSRQNVQATVIQAIMENEHGLRVARVCHKKLPTDRMVLP